MVEVVHNDNLIFIKKFDIIYIQEKELSDIVPHIKALTANVLQCDSLMVGHFYSKEKSWVQFPLAYKS